MNHIEQLTHRLLARSGRYYYVVCAKVGKSIVALDTFGNRSIAAAAPAPKPVFETKPFHEMS